MTELGNVAPPNIKQRFSLLDRAVSGQNLNRGQNSRTARSSKDNNRYSLFGGTTFPSSVIF
eukprot:7618848-Pyramimonas_sp.AAC.1